LHGWLESEDAAVEVVADVILGVSLLLPLLLLSPPVFPFLSPFFW